MNLIQKTHSQTTANWHSEAHARRRKYRYLISASHHVTWQLGKWWPSMFPFVFVLGYPKSGTSWACQLLADYLHLPFPQHSILPIGCAAVVHGHERWSPKYPQAVYVMRDGRDAMVSLYFHLAGDQRNSHTDGKRLTRFVANQLRHPSASGVNWAHHVAGFLDHGDAGPLLRYEDLLADPITSLGTALRKLTGEEVDLPAMQRAIDRFSFQQQTGRARGSEDRASYLRKGQPGDWRNFFTPEAAEIFAKYCGKELIAAGYEQDESWLDDCHRRSAA